MPGFSTGSATPAVFMAPPEPLTHADVMKMLSWFQRVLIVLPLGIALWLGLTILSLGTISVARTCLMLVAVLAAYLIFTGVKSWNTKHAYSLKIRDWLPTATMPPVPDTLEGEDRVADDDELVKLIATVNILDCHKDNLVLEMEKPTTLDAANTFLASNHAWNWEMEEYCLRVHHHELMLEKYLARLT